MVLEIRSVAEEDEGGGKTGKRTEMGEERGRAERREDILHMLLLLSLLLVAITATCAIVVYSIRFRGGGVLQSQDKVDVADDREREKSASDFGLGLLSLLWPISLLWPNLSLFDFIATKMF